MICLGGGPSGIYPSYILSKYSKKHLKICIVERDDRLGGEFVFAIS